MMSSLRLLLPLLLFFIGASGVHAENRYALVIGNSAYAKVGRLPNAGNDARLIADTLQKLDFEVHTIFDANEDALGAALDDLAARISSIDVVAFYYAGHGIQKDGENYLIPVDAELQTATAIERETIRLQSFLDIIEKAPIGLVFLDACRNNPFAETLLEQESASGRDVQVTRGLAVVRAKGDMLITFATLPNTVASDGAHGNSPFARALAKNLPTPGVEVSVLMKRVTRDVIAETGRSQRPQQLSQMQAEFYFKPGDGAQSVSAPAPAPTVAAAAQPVLLSAYPSEVGTGEEISLFADLPEACSPIFLAISPTRKVTPIPAQFFKTEQAGGQRVRYEISPGSRYGLIVQEQDERGRNFLGLMCLNQGLPDDRSARVELLRSLSEGLEKGELEGSLLLAGASPVPYSFADVIIK
ncbi:caspase family protein [Rhizobium sp. L1K21]|uniref:caspase family protein n=1 Tax=Rhizobium sp. L1K21 TaxID=2954933 RepID=UPI0020931C64|nr:caspase family protein [Rhizobium sp. L1K21]MCO6184655.1 caspase family protein [Rhizobium sp. L1K21]